MSPAEIEREISAGQARREDGLDVWPDNALAWDVWLQLTTEWNVAFGAMGGIAYLGLPARAIESTANLMGIRGRKKRARLFQELKEMEEAALPVLNGAEA